MKKIVFRSQEDEQLYNAIENFTPYWHVEELPDHPVEDRFRRELCVTMFNCPTDELYVIVIQKLYFKDSGEHYKDVAMPMWHVTKDNKEQIIMPDGSYMLADEYDVDEEGNIIEDTKTEIEVKANSTKYVRFLTSSKLMYVPDIFSNSMIQYKEKFAEEIDKI